MGPGYWLDRTTKALHRVDTHNDWLLRANNQQAVSLNPRYVSVLSTLDPQQEIDEIRMIGVRAGLIRFRDYQNRLSIQFFDHPSHVQMPLDLIAETLPRVFEGVEHFLTIQNLYDDSKAAIWSQELIRRLDNGEAIMEVHEDPDGIPYNVTLRKKIDALLNESQSRI